MPSHQSTRWIFVINNPTQAEKDAVAEFGQHEHCKYLVVGRERGAQGTPHLQGFVVLARGYTRTRVSNLWPRAHLEPARGSSIQAATYCKKDGDFDEYGTCPAAEGATTVLGPFYDWGEAYIRDHGHAPSSPEIARAHPTVYLRYPRCVRLFQNLEPPPTLREGELREWQDDLEQALEDPPDDRSIQFFVDPDGGKGKTWFQQYYLSKYPDKTQVLSIGRREDVAHSVDVTKSVFLFNIPRDGMQYLQYPILEMLKDRMVYSPKYNSRMKYLHHLPHILVFCNEEPDMTKMTEDRFKITHLS